MHQLGVATIREKRRLVLLMAVLGLGSLMLHPSASARQDSAETNHYEFREVHNPDGIGKFYMGREIAQVMGHEFASWLERPQRVAEEDPDMLVSELTLQADEVIADIGAGTGYLSRRLAQKVGPAGKVLAVDVQPEMLVLLTKSSARLGITNVTAVLGTTTDPHLAFASADLAVMVDVYHEFDFPYEMMQGICRAVKPGGRVVLVEYRAEDPAVPIKPLHKMTEAQVKKEMSVLPLEWVQTIQVLPRQHMVFFRRRLEEIPPKAGAHGHAAERDVSRESR